MSPEAWISLGVGAFAVVGGIVGQYGAFKYFSGVVNTRLTEHDKKFVAIDTQQDNQWSKINANTAAIEAQTARCQAIHGAEKANGRAHY